MVETIREAYGEALVRHGRDDPRVVVLDSDVSSSSRSALFAAACPDRFFNVGVAEASMVAMAAGFASEGKVPFANTFAVFLTTLGALAARTLGGYARLNVKLMGAYGGMSDGYDGATHHALEDLAVMRALPNFTVMAAADAVQTDWIVRHAIAADGPLYVRLSREAQTPLYAPGEKFTAGRGNVLRDGRDATILACGSMCGSALAAAGTLAEEGISARVVDLFTLKPLDAELVHRCARETGALVTAEEHNIIGGLGGAVAEALADGAWPAPLERVGMRDEFSQTGDYPGLLRHYGLTPEGIAEAVKRAVARKRRA